MLPASGLWQRKRHAGENMRVQICGLADTMLPEPIIRVWPSAQVWLRRAVGRALSCQAAGGQVSGHRVFLNNFGFAHEAEGLFFDGPGGGAVLHQGSVERAACFVVQRRMPGCSDCRCAVGGR